MRIRTAAVVLVMAAVLVAFSVSASAQQNPLIGGFTQDEKTSLLHLRESMRSGLEVVKDHCGVADGTENDCKDVLAGVYETSQCIGWLFNVAVSPSSSASAAILAQARPLIVAEAWSDCDRAIYEYSRADSFFSDADYLDAVAELNLVDRTLAYATPYPPNYPDQFGPHGDYSEAQSTLWSQMQYGRAASVGWLDGMLAGELPACPAALSNMSESLQLGMGDAWFLSAEVMDSSLFDKWLTPLEETFPESVRRPMAELHIINGPGDLSSAKSSTDRLRLSGDAMALCMKSTLPKLWEAWRRLNDSWANTDDWNGEFVKIQ